MKVLVQGAGIGGLGAAIALRRRGIHVDLVEIKPEFSAYGVGINQPANSLRALRSLGVLDEILTVG
jgi:2-polyprenyl-6-methoxyphenol hydroxylase-like FAD-dependent oxidoreductase